MGADSLIQYTKANCFTCELAQADMCSVDLSNIKLYVDKQTSFVLTLRDSSGRVCHNGKNQIDIHLINDQGSSIKGDIQQPSQGQVKILLTPKRRGLYHLNVNVNRAHIKNSPFTVTVYMPLHSLSQPVATISGLQQPVSLVYSETEDKVIATIVLENRLMDFKVDSQFHVTQCEFITLQNINEIAHDATLDMFFVTTLKHQLHKLSSDGSILKTVGRLGTRNAEFNYPNGLRVSKNRELYVCDSNNNRVQVFNLNLEFKRSFGNRGTGKGQFNNPGDVEFDSRDNIYVAEQDNHRIQVFSCTECHLYNIRGIERPISLFIHDNIIYTTDFIGHKVWIMNTSGEVIAMLGKGYLRRPEGITMDKDGFLYVTSHDSQIVVF